MSAKTGIGINWLLEAIATKLHGAVIEENVYISVKQARLRAQLYQLDAVLTEKIDEEGGWHLTIKLTPAQKQSLFPASIE